ncbi:MAG: DUF5106 domain-containing protein [Bacteroidales bacterium]
MKRIIFYSVAITLSALLSVSCHNNTSDKNRIPQAKKGVDVPTIITDPLQRENYISEHFWNGFNFKDSAHLNLTSRIDSYYMEYLGHLYSSDEATAKRSAKSFTDSILTGDAAVRDYFLKIIELSLYDPNSTYRNETLYIWILEVLTESSNLDKHIIERYREQLDLALKNRPGTIAMDFEYTTNKSKTGTIHKTKGEYILLFFYDPECQTCQRAIEFLKENESIKKMGSRLVKLAMYTGEEMAKWMETTGKFANDWIIAHDNNMAVSLNKLYDRRPSPSIYLLDSTKKVLLKDALPDEVAALFIEVIPQCFLQITD